MTWDESRETPTPQHAASEAAALGAYPVTEQTHNHGPWCEPEEVRHLAEDSEKAYSDAVPGPSDYPHPLTMRPVAPRPALLEGHAANSPGYDPPRQVQKPFAQAHPVFREPLTEGHAAQGTADAHR